MIELLRAEVDLQIAEHVTDHEAEEDDARDGHQNLLAQRRTDETYGLTHRLVRTPCVDLFGHAGLTREMLTFQSLLLSPEILNGSVKNFSSSRKTPSQGCELVSKAPLLLTEQPDSLDQCFQFLSRFTLL